MWLRHLWTDSLLNSFLLYLNVPVEDSHKACSHTDSPSEWKPVCIRESPLRVSPRQRVSLFLLPPVQLLGLCSIEKPPRFYGSWCALCSAGWVGTGSHLKETQTSFCSRSVILMPVFGLGWLIFHFASSSVWDLFIPSTPMKELLWIAK